MDEENQYIVRVLKSYELSQKIHEFSKNQGYLPDEFFIACLLAASVEGRLNGCNIETFMTNCNTYWGMTERLTEEIKNG